MTDINKENGAKVPLGYFNNDEHSHVSAVIFSTVATAGKARMVSNDPRLIISSNKRYNDYGTQPIFEILEKQEANEHFLDGLVVFHNPNAIKPFRVEQFYHPIISHVSNDISDIPHRTLFQREVIVIRNSHSWSKKRKRQKGEEIKKFLFKNIEENEFPVLYN
ncbi:hypothetical protein [Bacillus alkalicellulosilyticus]|uniref:hypothetical protein n=1 Tax=Alkalihalobacterium alkalicellulosilyticum TaxID=1912214 RepID=UPI000996AEDF|nr:hypothetical protein [Bacillus alkalicellulosilyticus]